MTTQIQVMIPLRERILATLTDYLPSRAEVIHRVMRLTSDPTTASGQLSCLVSKDPALTAMVLRLSNSSHHGRVGMATSLNEAILVLGFERLRTLVVATSAASMFGNNNNKDPWEETLWNHSVAVAIGARLVAGRVEPAVAEEAYLAGLMHDLAQLVLLQRFRHEYRPVLQEAQQGQRDILEIEAEKLGFTHDELGALMLERWRFPPRLLTAVRYHHNPDLELSTTGAGAPDRTLARIVCLADALSKSLGFSFAQPSPVDPARLPCLEQLGLSPDTIPQVLTDLAATHAEEQKLFAG